VLTDNEVGCTTDAERHSCLTPGCAGGAGWPRTGAASASARAPPAAAVHFLLASHDYLMPPRCRGSREHDNANIVYRDRGAPKDRTCSPHGQLGEIADCVLQWPPATRGAMGAHHRAPRYPARPTLQAMGRSSMCRSWNRATFSPGVRCALGLTRSGSSAHGSGRRQRRR
jgi:hypothetical protein